jgi:hypothetical protein
MAITCKRGSSQHCVKDDFAFLCKHINLGTHRTETPPPIIMKLCTVNYVALKTFSAKIDIDRLAGSFSPYG